MLYIRFALYGSLHESIVQFDGNIGSGYFTFRHLGIDEFLGVGVFDAHCHHQRSPSAVLCHLACGIAVSFHKRHKSGGGQCGILYRTAGGTDMGKVMADASAALHELDLLFVDADNASVRIRMSGETYYKTVRERTDLKIISYTRHRTSLRNDILKSFQKRINFLLLHRIGIFVLDAGYFRGYAMVHVIGCKFIKITV